MTELLLYLVCLTAPSLLLWRCYGIIIAKAIIMRQPRGERTELPKRGCVQPRGAVLWPEAMV